MKLYKGYTRAQLIDILADYAVFTATINNDHGGAPQNTNKGDYVGLYSTYPMNSRIFRETRNLPDRRCRCETDYRRNNLF